MEDDGLADYQEEGPSLLRKNINENKTLNKIKSFINHIHIIKNNDNEEEEKEKDEIFLKELFTFIETYLVNMDGIDELDRHLYFKYFLKLIFYDYIIFLPNNFFMKSYYLLKYKKNYLKYLDKYNVIYFTYEDKNLIFSIMGYLNNFIKNTKEEIQKTLIKKNYIKKKKKNIDLGLKTKAIIIEGM